MQPLLAVASKVGFSMPKAPIVVSNENIIIESIRPAAEGKGLELDLFNISNQDQVADIKPGNALPLRNIPLGTAVHNIEIRHGRGGQMVRSAGASAQVMAKEARYILRRMPSGELRRFNDDCLATIGQVGNIEHSNVSLGKAGRKRLMGWRPTVRGSAMTPRDHPHGGGEGRSPIGHPGPKTPWGKPALGYRTRRNKQSDRLILRRRK